MKKIFRKVGWAALVLGLFIFPGHELLLNVIESVAAQTISGILYTSPVVVPGSIPFNGGPQSSAIKANGGTFTCTSSGTITIANTNVTANSVFLFGLKAAGTPAAFTVSTVTPGTGFTVVCGSDTSIYNYIILG